MSELLLRRSENARTTLERDKLLDQATHVAKTMRGNKWNDSHSYHILAKIGIEKIRHLVKDAATTGVSLTLEEEIKSTEHVLAEGLQRFPCDSFLLATDADLASLLKDANRVTDSLKKAFEANPRSGYLAMRLSSNFESDNDFIQSEKVLRKALSANNNDKHLHFRFAQHLMKRGVADGDTLAYHLQRSFMPGDRNYQAQILYGRQLFLNSDPNGSRAVFDSLKGVRESSQLKRNLLFPLSLPFGGSVAKLDINWASVRRDGISDFIHCEKSNMLLSTWRNLTYGTRVKFRIYFNFYGPSGSDIVIDELVR